ncbi:MAG: benzoate/H(+) symporter BenE family transporter [Pseudoxanthomonas sp.]
MDAPTPAAPPALLRDFSLSALVAGFVTVLVGYASSAVIVFQAARAVGANDAQMASWMWALGIGMGVTCIGLSLRWRMPAVTAWSTPGAAMLAAGSPGLAYPEAIGAFVLCALLMMVAGFSGVFERSLSRIPASLAAGMLAGVLLRFGLDAFVAVKAQPLLVLATMAAWLFGRLLFPRYAVIAALAVGVLVAGSGGLLHPDRLHGGAALPVFTMPSLSLAAVFGIALPLFVVTMTSQNVPGVAVARGSGYALPVSAAVGWTSAVNAVLAPFGGYALNLAAITAAICMGREAHPDPARRYVAAVCAGGFYLLLGLFGAAVAGLFAAFPKELVAAIAGIALLGTIGNSLANAMRDEHEREPALIAFLVTASGVSIANIGSAFWGLLAGALTLWLWRRRGV